MDNANQDNVTAVIAEYQRDHRFPCKVAAKYVRKTLEDALRESGIKFSASSRAKDCESLAKKIRRDGKCHMRIDALLPKVGTGCDPNRIKDLAGARVSLYFPSDWVFVEAEIFKQFMNVTTKLHPEPDKTQPTRKRFIGYAAKHYYVDSNNELRAEIQVASAVMHAWMEVDHDLVYKEASPLDAEELAILDGLNGLTSAGEVLLGALKTRLLDRSEDRRVIEVPDQAAPSLENAIKNSKTEIFVIGQNLYASMVGKPAGIEKAKALQNALIDRLNAQKTLKATLIVADPQDEKQMTQLAYGFPEFREHLLESIAAMNALGARAIREGINERLIVASSRSVGPESVTLSDPDDSDGVAYLRYTPLGSRPEHRAIITIDKQRHPVQFSKINCDYKWRLGGDGGFQPL